jgi:hypothetical protein
VAGRLCDPSRVGAPDKCPRFTEGRKGRTALGARWFAIRLLRADSNVRRSTCGPLQQQDALEFESLAQPRGLHPHVARLRMFPEEPGVRLGILCQECTDLLLLPDEQSPAALTAQRVAR